VGLIRPVLTHQIEGLNAKNFLYVGALAVVGLTTNKPETVSSTPLTLAGLEKLRLYVRDIDTSSRLVR